MMEHNFLTLEQLKKGKGPLWVLNNSNAGPHYGEVLIEVRTKPKKTKVTGRNEIHDLSAWMHQRATGIPPLMPTVELDTFEVEHLRLPMTWLPMCVTNEFPRKTLLGCDSFIKALEKGTIAAIDENLATKLLALPEAQEELERLDKQQDARRFVESASLQLVPKFYSGSPEWLKEATSEWLEESNKARSSHLADTALIPLFKLPQPIPGVGKPLSQAPVEIRNNYDYDMHEGYTCAVVDLDDPLPLSQLPEIKEEKRPSLIVRLLNTVLGRK